MVNHQTNRFNRNRPTPALTEFLCRLYEFLDTPLDSLPYTSGLEAITSAVKHRFAKLSLSELLPFPAVTEKQVWRWLLVLRKDGHLPRVGRQREANDSVSWNH